MNIKKLNEKLQKVLNESAPEGIFKIEFVDRNQKLQTFQDPCEIWYDYDTNGYYVTLPFVDDKLTNMDFDSKEEAYDYAIDYLKKKYAANGTRFWKNSYLAEPGTNFI